MFYFILQKFKDPISSLCQIKKEMCGASHTSTLKYVLLVCFSSLSQSYSGVWWCAMSSIHFSVPAIFVLFVYLDVFLWFNFLCMNILVLTSWYQRWHCKILFSLTKFFEKKNMTKTTLVLFYLALVSPCYN